MSRKLKISIVLLFIISLFLFPFKGSSQELTFENNAVYVYSLPEDKSLTKKIAEQTTRVILENLVAKGFSEIIGKITTPLVSHLGGLAFSFLMEMPLAGNPTNVEIAFLSEGKISKKVPTGTPFLPLIYLTKGDQFDIGVTLEVGKYEKGEREWVISTQLMKVDELNSKKVRNKSLIVPKRSLSYNEPGEYIVSVKAWSSKEGRSKKKIKIFEQQETSHLGYAYYPFNGNANDESGNGNDGVVHGATLSSDRYGNANSSYSFEGKDNYITIPEFSELPTSNDPFSICLWAYISNDSPSPFRFYRWGSNETGMGAVDEWNAFSFIDASYKAFDKYDGLVHTFYGVTYKEDTWIEIPELQRGTWFHTAVTYDGSTVKIYFNGDLKKTHSDDANVHSSNITIGPHGFHVPDASYPLNKIDDIRLYDKCLSDSEILDIYNSEKP